ncbi:MAG: type VI secretion system-associated protein TagF [Rhizobacter sp.]
MNMQARSHYFGKLPSRGDFLRSTGEPMLVQALDGWMSQTLLLMRDDSHWQATYDAAAPVQFAILGAQSRSGLAGHLVTSQDTAGRRFPFVMAATFELPVPSAFLPHSPMALSPLWCRLGAQVRLAQAAEDFAMVQGRLAHQPIDVDLDDEANDERSDFFRQQFSMARFESVVSSPEARVSLRQTLLALGLLLRPVLSRGPAGIDRGLVLPLPRDPMPRPHVLSFWVDLVTGFFKGTPVEIALFVTTHGEQPVLVVGFHGASPATLRTVIDPQACREQNVAVAQAAWVDEVLGADDNLSALSMRLRDGSLSLAMASELFRETFLDAPLY